VNDGNAVEIIYGGHEAILEFLFGYDADVAQDRAGELGKEALDEIEPGAVRGREGEFEAMCGLRSRLWSLWRCARNDCRGSA
jgi:hypothetical protein